MDALEKARRTLVYWTSSEHPTCIILVGLPGTGKSHVSRYLHDAYGYTVLSGENITHALFWGTKCQPEQYQEAYATLYSFAQELLAEWYSIVIDGTNLRYAHRKQAYDAIGADVKTICIHLMTDDLTAKKRIRKRWERSDDPTNILSSCSDETFEAFKSNIELGNENEKIHTFTSDENIFQSIDRLIAHQFREIHNS